jgi:serine/threonine protein kinase
MEYVDGEDLRTIVDYLAPVPSNIAALLIMEIARGLEYTHAQNIIHRDIKPSNILISYDGDVKLIDFGVAKDDTSTRLTMTGLIVGTPAYMSPEQASGEPLSPQSDLYALGTLLYELLTGIKPFAGENHTEILAKITANRFTPAERINPDIPYRMRHVVRKALRNDRNRRYKNATELIYDLERCVSWQLRSRKKEVISRFLRQLDKNTQIPTDDSLKASIYVKGFSRGWRVLQYSVLTLVLYLTLLLGFQFKESELGYLRLYLPDSDLSFRVNEQESISTTDASPLIGPLLEGSHSIEVTHPTFAGTFLGYVNIIPGDTVGLHVGFEISRDSAQISILSSPMEAQVTLDGVELGPTPLFNKRVPSGTHQFKLTHPKCITQTHQVYIRSTEPYILNFQLRSR